MFHFEQIATRTLDIDAAIAAMAVQGHANWVCDEVAAVHLHARPSFNLGENFAVRLAFNYEIFQGLEFELIQLTDGKTVQLLHEVSGDTRISHFGYHVRDWTEGQPDALIVELDRLHLIGMMIAQVSQTTWHKNTPRRYRYAFAFWPTIGAPIKIIQRIPADLTVAHGRETYRWLSFQK